MIKNRQNQLRHAFCVNCSNNYVVKDPNVLYGRRSPMVLQCGHSQCEACIRESLKGNSKVICKICKVESDCGSLCTVENLRNEFPLNIYLVGSLFLRAYKSKVEDTMITFKTKSDAVTTKKPFIPQNDRCFECAENSSDVSCKECNNTYCNSCFDAVHKRARALQTHHKSFLEKSRNVAPCVQYCTIHKEQKVEFYCKRCSENTCSYCALSSHVGHEVVHKLAENEKKLEELKEKFIEANNLNKRYQYFRKKAAVPINKLDTSMGNYGLSRAEKAVSSHFDRLHALLQLKEGELLDTLHKCRSQVDEARQEVIKELDSSIQDFEEVISTCQEIQKSENLAWVDVDEAIERLDALLNKPAYVALKEPEYTDEKNDNQDSIFSVVNDTVFDIISSHCNITVPALAHYSLLSKSDVPEDYVIEEIPVEEERIEPVRETIKKPSSITSSSGGTSEKSSRSSKANLRLNASSIGFKNPRSRQTSSKKPVGLISQPFEKPFNFEQKVSKSHGSAIKTYNSNFDLTAGSMDTVRICHFMNPSDFYVHRKGADVELSNLDVEYSKLNMNAYRPPEKPMEGSMYLVRYETDKKWYRGLVEKVENVERILVKYIDYGNTEYVAIESLRYLPPKFTIIPPLAIHCKLYDCYPNAGLEWSTAAIKLMASIVTGSVLTMHVMRTDEDSSRLEIDLTKFDDDSRLSLRDALIFHELASFIVTNTIATEEGRLGRKGSFFAANDFKEGQIFDVLITHVVNPSHFFLQIISKNSSFLKNIARQMNDLYKRNSDNNYPGMVYSPSVGLPVAVFDVNGSWHRGQVTALPGNRQVEVYFVDTGETKTVPWKNLRILQNKFLRMSAQAVKCTLSDVIPTHKSRVWSTASVQTFRDLVCEKKLKATIVAITPDYLKVALYECSELVDTCLNALFVQFGHAESVGITSTLVEFPKYHEMKNPGPSSNTFKKNNNQSRPLFTKRPTKSERHESTSSICSETSNTAEETCVKDEGTGSTRYAVTILKVVDPGNFYVSFNVQKEQMKKLFEDMNEYYNSVSANKNCEWEKGKLCAVLKEDDSQWYRGVIEEILPEDKVQVLLKDIATTIVVSKDSLAELVEEFLQGRDGAFKCRLAGVIAAGGQDTWPGIATDVFQEQIDEANNKIYFSQKGELNPTDKCIRAELWVKRTIIGGPLDPSKEEWHSINRFLIDQGFALPDKSDPPTPAASVFQDFSDRSSYSSLKLTDTNSNVSDWMKKSELLNEKPRAGALHAARKSTKVSEPGESEDTKAPKEWPSPVPFNDLTFVGYPTYVDHNCNIYIQDAASANTLDIIQRALWSRFQDSKPMAHDLYWFAGQLCIAQYHADKKWYRAKVIEVNADNTVTVEMVDYGNVEICKAAELRKNICMTDIPLQCHKCSFNSQLQPVSEDGRWPIAVLDFIHGTIVEKICQIQLTGSEGNYNVISLKCPGGLDICEILLSMNYARYVLDNSGSGEADDDSASVIIEDESVTPARSLSPPAVVDPQVDQSCLNSEVGLTADEVCAADSKMTWYDLVLRDERKTVLASYKTIELPEDVTEFLAEVTSILSPTKVMTQIYHENENSLADIKKRFIGLQEELQRVSQFQPELSNAVVGDPCICQYSFDQRWYRGLVMDVYPDDTVKVKYVDYGNVEVAPKQSVREIQEVWMEVPMQGLQCTFWGVNITDVSNIKECLELLEESIFISPVLVKIKERTPELKVQLFKDSGSIFVYQKLIDSNIYEVTEINDDDVD